MEPTRYDHTNYTFHIHIHYSGLKFRWKIHVFSNGNWLVLAGTGTDGPVLLEAMESGVSWLNQKVVMDWALVKQI